MRWFLILLLSFVLLGGCAAEKSAQRAPAASAAARPASPPARSAAPAVRPAAPAATPQVQLPRCEAGSNCNWNSNQITVERIAPRPWYFWVGVGATTALVVGAGAYGARELGLLDSRVEFERSRAPAR